MRNAGNLNRSIDGLLARGLMAEIGGDGSVRMHESSQSYDSVGLERKGSWIVVVYQLELRCPEVRARYVTFNALNEAHVHFIPYVGIVVRFANMSV